MRHFFTEDVSPDNFPVVELQRRSLWIGLAFILQALNEIDHDWYMPYIKPFGALIPFALILGSFVAMAMAFRPTRLRQQARQGQPGPWQRLLLILTIILTIAGFIEGGRSLIMCFLPPQFSNDGTSLDANAATLLLEGRNPYTDSNMLDMARKYSIQPNWTTPLQQGQFANRVDYPSLVDFQTVLDTDLKAGTAPEFESKVSYPSLSFLTLVPFVLFNDYNVLPFYVGSYLLLIAIAWKFARPEMRNWVLLLAMANIPMWASTVGGNLDIFYTLLIVMVWLFRDKRWTSALFLGLALASKQIAWFFIPFYMIMVLRHYNFKELVYRLAIAGTIGLAFNLPFIVWNPQAWLAGILAPVSDPMFPMGVGIVDLSVTHLLPFLPKWAYNALEGGAMLASLLWYWRICKKFPEAAMLLAVLPLFFAWRSLASYFYCAAFPLFILMAARVPAARQTSSNDTPQRTVELPAYRNQALFPEMPAMAGIRAFTYPAHIFRSITQLHQ
ncbi:MAG: hypothetical protein NVSMB27_45990 [Ktedonobacteraceae bacterium]